MLALVHLIIFSFDLTLLDQDFSLQTHSSSLCPAHVTLLFKGGGASQCGDFFLLHFIERADDTVKMFVSGKISNCQQVQRKYSKLTILGGGGDM